jgi:hypothetical protein
VRRRLQSTMIGQELFHSRKKQTRTEIVSVFQCDVHSLPDKPSACHKDSNSGLCYPITEQNLNLWATLCVRAIASINPVH